MTPYARRLQRVRFTEETSAAYLKYDAHVEEIGPRRRQLALCLDGDKLKMLRLSLSDRTEVNKFYANFCE